MKVNDSYDALYDLQAAKPVTSMTAIVVVKQQYGETPLSMAWANIKNTLLTPAT